MSNEISVPAWYLSLDPLAGYDPYNTEAYVLGSAAFQRLRSIAETAETGFAPRESPSVPNQGPLDVHAALELDVLAGYDPLSVDSYVLGSAAFNTLARAGNSAPECDGSVMSPGQRFESAAQSCAARAGDPDSKLKAEAAVKRDMCYCMSKAGGTDFFKWPCNAQGDCGSWKYIMGKCADPAKHPVWNPGGGGYWECGH